MEDVFVFPAVHMLGMAKCIHYGYTSWWTVIEDGCGNSPDPIVDRTVLKSNMKPMHQIVKGVDFFEYFPGCRTMIIILVVSKTVQSRLRHQDIHRIS